MVRPLNGQTNVRGFFLRLLWKRLYRKRFLNPDNYLDSKRTDVRLYEISRRMATPKTSEGPESGGVRDAPTKRRRSYRFTSTWDIFS